jgi:hypothetical protein
MGFRQYLGVVVLLLAASAGAETVCVSGCDHTTTALPDPGTQSPTTMNTNRAAIESAVNENSGRIDTLEADGTLDADLTIDGRTKHFIGPQEGDFVEVLGFSFAVAITGWRCNVTPDDAGITVPAILEECTSAGCTTVDTLTCDDNLDATFETTITEPAIAATARVRVRFGAPSATMTTQGVAADIEYSRKVVLP